jgi:general secretion pathway protein A
MSPPIENIAGFAAVPPPAVPDHADAAELLRLVEPLAEPIDEPSPAGVPFDAAALAGDDFLGYYGLRENPFSDSVNPAFFYKTSIHEEAVIRTMLAVRHNISLGLVTGPSGMGKTLVSQMVLQNLDPVKYQPVLVLVSPGMSKAGLLREILDELDVATPAGPFVSTRDLLKLLGDRVIELHQQGRKLIVLIDECHFLAGDALHMIRTISNIELPEQKLTTCVLFGEDRFLKRLEHPSYESLRNRIYLRSELTPLTGPDCDQYIKYRLLVCGREAPLFEGDALAALHEQSGGICRRINKLGLLALLEGFLRRQPVPDETLIRRCADRL